MTLWRERSFIDKKKLISTLIAAPVALCALLYGGGFIAQFIYNYQTWQGSGGTLYGDTSPKLPDPAFFSCLRAVFRFPSGLCGLGVCVGLIAVLLFAVMRMGDSDGTAGGYDKARNFEYSSKGTYGTAGFMSEKEMKSSIEGIFGYMNNGYSIDQIVVSMWDYFGYEP